MKLRRHTIQIRVSVKNVSQGHKKHTSRQPCFILSTLSIFHMFHLHQRILISVTFV